MKIVLNTYYGGYSLSKKAYEYLGFKWDEYGYADNKDFGIDSENDDAFRSDERLVKCVEELGKDASGSFASLEVVEIPDDVKWVISEYYGYESVEAGKE